MDPIIASDNAETALVVHGDAAEEEDDKQSEQYSSPDEGEDEELPPGPLDPEKCTVGGPGTGGGAAQAPVSIHIHARDGRDKRLEEGGDYVVVRVLPGNAAKAGGAVDAEAFVKDNGDGTYTATYSVAARGDYQLTVEINGSAVGGSPFPVFFSPPEEHPQPDSAADVPAGGLPPPPDVGQALPPPPSIGMPLPIVSIMGAEANAAKVEFPKDRDPLERTVLVGNLNPQVTLEQLRQLFSYSGSVRRCDFSGLGDKFALVEFAEPKEAEHALTLDKLLVVDQQIRVEAARNARDAAGAPGGSHFAPLQAQQIQALQKAQMEQSSLAAQVAQMRVAAKQNPTHFGGIPKDSTSQKAAALSAIAALSKRLTIGTDPAPRESSPPRGALKRRREVSPTIRYRSEKHGRSRSPSRRRSPVRSPPRRRSVSHRRTPPRRRSRERLPSRERERRRERSRERRDSQSHRSHRVRPSRERDSQRDSSRERRHRRERSRERRDRRDSRRSPEDRPRHDRDRSERDRSRDGRRRREGGPADGDRDERSRRPERHSTEPRPESSGRSPERSPGAEASAARPIADAAQAANGQGASDKADEAQELREKALEMMKALTKENAVTGTESPKDGEREHKHKHRKEKRHKKEKRSKRDLEDAPDAH